MEESVEKVLEGWNNRRAGPSGDACPLFENLCPHSPIDLILPTFKIKWPRNTGVFHEQIDLTAETHQALAWGASLKEFKRIYFVAGQKR